jgi:hypothetical protein
MIFFSIAIIARLTLYFINYDISINLNDIFFVVFYIFLIKTSVDFYKYFINSNPIVYVISLPLSKIKPLFEIFFLIFWIQLGLWVFFSSIYHIFLYIHGINLSYPLIYLQFLFGIILSIIIGAIIPIHIYNKKKYRIIPVVILLIILWFRSDILSILIIILLSLIYLIISLNYSYDSHLFVHRKKRKKESINKIKLGVKKIIFYKESTILWRDKLLLSIIFTSVFIGFFSGYFAIFGESDFLPEGLKQITSIFSNELYAFFGVYIMTIYSSVFISLNLFLNEENTLWIIRNIPISEKTIIYGKSLSLFLPFLCSIPFIAYFLAFTLGESFLYLIWFFTFSFLAGIIISFPLGAKYVGKKSDIMLLYSVSMIILFILGLTYSFTSIVNFDFINSIIFFLLIILFEIFLLFLSFEISANILSKKNE